MGSASPWIGLSGAAAALLSVAGVLVFSGWRELSAAYPLAGRAPDGRVLGSGVFRGWLGYNNAIIYAADDAGLYLLPLPAILSWCHSPIFVPWREVSGFEERGGFWGRGFRMRTLKAARVDFAIRPRAFEALRPAVEAAGVPIRPKNS